MRSPDVYEMTKEKKYQELLLEAEALTGGEAEIYDVNGRRQVKLQKGVNIIRTKDGRTNKVMVK